MVTSPDPAVPFGCALQRGQIYLLCYPRGWERSWWGTANRETRRGMEANNREKIKPEQQSVFLMAAVHSTTARHGTPLLLPQLEN